MKRLILTLLLFVNVTMLKAQFTENFDGPGPYGLTSAGTPDGTSMQTIRRVFLTLTEVDTGMVKQLH